MRSVAELPLNGRDPLQLATITPGVLPGQKAANGVPPGEDFIGAGTREIQNSISLDGISIVNNLITTTPFHPSVDSIQEFEVQTGTYSAQYGAYLGAHLNLITKRAQTIFTARCSSFFAMTSSTRATSSRSQARRRLRSVRINSASRWVVRSTFPSSTTDGIEPSSWPITKASAWLKTSHRSIPS